MYLGDDFVAVNRILFDQAVVGGDVTAAWQGSELVTGRVQHGGGVGKAAAAMKTNDALVDRPWERRERRVTGK
jgi:hypothetical protein